MVASLFMSVALAATQGVPPPVIVSGDPVLSPSQATEAGYDAQCIVTDSSGISHVLRLEQRGSRGFRYPDRSGASALSTPRIVSVTEDESDILGVGPLELVAPFPGWAGELRGGPDDSFHVFARLGTPAPIEIRENGRTGTLRYSGSCELTRIVQEPLTDGEITEYLRQ